MERILTAEVGVEAYLGRGRLRLKIRDTKALEHIERQLRDVGALAVQLDDQPERGETLRVIFEGPGETPLFVVQGTVATSWDQGATIHLALAAPSTRARWTAWRRAFKAPTGQMHPTNTGQIFQVSSAGLSPHLSKKSDLVSRLTFGVSRIGQIDPLLKALDEGRVLQVSLASGQSLNPQIDLHFMVVGDVEEVSFDGRMVCMLPDGALIEPLGLTPDKRGALEKLRLTLREPPESRAKRRGASPSRPLERPKGTRPTSGCTKAPEPPLSKSQLPEDEGNRTTPPTAEKAPPPTRPAQPDPPRAEAPPDAKARPLEPPRPTPTPIVPRRLPKPGSRPSSSASFHRLEESLEAMASLNPYEIFDLHYSAHQKLIDERFEELKGKYTLRSHPEAAGGGEHILEGLQAKVAETYELINSLNKRIALRKTLVNDSQIQTTIDHYLEKGKMAHWRGEARDAVDAFKRVLEMDPRNVEARKRFKKKE